MNLSLRRSTSALLCLVVVINHRTRPLRCHYDHLLESPVQPGVDLIGYAVTGCITIGVVFSLGFGIWRIRQTLYMLLAITAFASGFIADSLVVLLTLVVLFLPIITAPIPFCYRVGTVCRQSFVRQQSEKSSQSYTKAFKHWLRPSVRHRRTCW